MIEKLSLTARIVEDIDEALRFYTETLGLEKKTDMSMGDSRWVTVGAEHDETVEIHLAPIDGGEGEEADRRAAMLGQQPSLTFIVDDCHATYETLRERGVEFMFEPEEQPYGIQAVARDLYGNGVVLHELPADEEAS